MFRKNRCVLRVPLHKLLPLYPQPCVGRTMVGRVSGPLSCPFLFLRITRRNHVYSRKTLNVLLQWNINLNTTTAYASGAFRRKRKGEGSSKTLGRFLQPSSVGYRISSRFVSSRFPDTILRIYLCTDGPLSHQCRRSNKHMQNPIWSEIAFGLTISGPG